MRRTRCMGCAMIIWVVFLFKGDVPLGFCDEITAEQETRFEELKGEGKGAYDNGEFEQACRHFEDALAIKDDPAILEYLGACYTNLKDYEKARQAYQRYLDTYPDSPKCGKIQRYIEQTVQDEQALVPRLSIDSTPPGVTVYLGTLGEEPLGVTPFEVTMQPGTYTLHGMLDGYEPIASELAISQGQHIVLGWVLTAPPTILKCPEQTDLGSPNKTDIAMAVDEATGDEGVDVLELTGWSVLGVGVVATVIGLVLQLDSADLSDQADDCYANRLEGGCSARDYNTYVDDSNHSADVALGLFIGGGAAVAAGVALLLWDLSQETSDESPVSILPFADPRGMGVTFQLSF